jgi:transposase
MNEGLRSAIQLLHSNGMFIEQITKEVGVGVGIVYSVI